MKATQESEQPGRVAILSLLFGMLTLLGSLVCLIVVAFLIQNSSRGVKLPSLLPFPVTFLSFWQWHAVKRGIIGKSAYILLFLFIFIGFFIAFRWGFDAPEGLLLLTLLATILALLFEKKSVLRIYISIGIAYVALAVAQVNNIYSVRTAWKTQESTYSDILIYALTMSTIFAVIWLFNRQLHAAYLRARASEEELRHHNENLEEEVEQRTEELRQEYFQRLTDLHRFVQYGKEASGLMHDLLNPLTALGIQVETLKKSGKEAEQVTRIQESLRYLERLVIGARRQIKQQAQAEPFSVQVEVARVVHSLEPLVNSEEIHFKRIGANCSLYANPALFAKVIQNILSNAVDSCQSQPGHYVITIASECNESTCIITITDNGPGIAPSHLKKLFSPSFSTKGERGIGLGLSLVKEIVEYELAGTVSIASDQKKRQTIVTLSLPLTVMPELQVPTARKLPGSTDQP